MPCRSTDFLGLASAADKGFVEEVRGVCEALPPVFVHFTPLGDSASRLLVIPPVQRLGEAIRALHDRTMNANDIFAAGHVVVGLSRSAA